MVLGKISEKTKMSTVIMALHTPNQASPKMSVACIPTPLAPTVLAMVLSDNIAANGRSVSVLYFFMSEAGLYPSSSRSVMYDSVVDISVDSNSEHTNDTPKARKRYNNR